MASFPRSIRARGPGVIRARGPGVIRARGPGVAIAAAGIVLALGFTPVLARTPGGGMGSSSPAGVTPQGGVSLDFLVGGLVQPLYVTHAGDTRLFVVEKPGRIRIVRFVDGAWKITGTFLDIRSRVGDGGSEQGLLGLAFHPNYAKNGRFYVDYTNNGGDTIVAEFRRKSFSMADPGSFRRVMKINQPFNNHNGGWLGFKGPYLYIATGDGGSAGDPGNRAQDLGSRLGKILRIKPLDPDGSGPKRFSVPADNPFVGRPGKDVIWSYGLRNPWRPSFDGKTGDIWIADVGQDRFEEVDHHETGKGKNFGWRRLEGRHLYPSGNLCQTNCKTLPIVEYKHDVAGPNDNCSVTGGYVSRRPGADLNGRYVYGDFCSGRIWDIPAGHELGDPIGAPTLSGRLISSFGEGADRRIYLTDLTGSLWLVVES